MVNLCTGTPTADIKGNMVFHLVVLDLLLHKKCPDVRLAPPEARICLHGAQTT